MKKIILVLAFLLAACGPSAQQHPVVVVPQLIATAEPYIDPSYPTAQVEVAAPNQTASGIEVRMERVSMEGKNINADVCFTLPDTSDWGVQSASLTYGGVVVQEFGTTLLSFQDPVNGVAGLRCDTLTFVVPPDADLTNAAIIIDSIGTTVREGEYCSVYMPKIQQAMLDRGIAITLDCIDVNGLLTMQILSIPPEMTQEQAEQIVYSDEFYTVKGPWTFPFGLAQ
ncbi:MAG: hypothetical protein IPO36_16345 [Anaerolineales bacterium]|jgi:hypothetical protein|uniref:hypothetical protein n=1 Tax=Candidatus Villigracilis affinis TaxID=3140682 RepID=UPI001B4731F5|nr:hypothetical protein [Anaerolineales bacterium]MBK9603390.1 hypothetical protein [Anaerolineales bacterium]MBP8047191.1 hypothetical protein [Anaerolineales bacterium]